MVKLTPELIEQSMQYINPVRDRELDLRGLLRTKSVVITYIAFIPLFLFYWCVAGYKIPTIENLGATLVGIYFFRRHLYL